MTITAMLNELSDDDLRSAGKHIEELLRQRDTDCKAKAMEQAKAMLAAAGLSVKDLLVKGRRRGLKGGIYRSGHAYHHPANKALTWNGTGKKPAWLVTLEKDGGIAVEVERAAEK